VLALVLTILGAVALVALGADVHRRLERGVEDRAPDGPSASHAGAMLSALFLLCLAIAVVVPWTTADSAKSNTYAESDAIVRTYRAAGDLPEPTAEQVQGDLRSYVRFIVDDEWSSMASGDLRPRSAEMLADIRAQVAALTPVDPEAEIVQEAVLEEVDGLFGARRQRGADAASTTPPVILVLTLLSGLAVLLFPFTAGARPRGSSLAPLVVMAVMLGVAGFLTFDIVHAFDGSLKVEPDAFRAALVEFDTATGR
jgi:hypothetical protein